MHHKTVCTCAVWVPGRPLPFARGRPTEGAVCHCGNFWWDGVLWGALWRFGFCTARICVQFMDDLLFRLLLYSFCSYIFDFSLFLLSPSFLFLLPHLPFPPALPVTDVWQILPTDPMAMINLISLNVRGLHALGKRHAFYRELEQMQGDVVFLQETHFTHTSVKLYAHQYPT